MILLWNLALQSCSLKQTVSPPLLFLTVLIFSCVNGQYKLPLVTWVLWKWISFISVTFDVISHSLALRSFCRGLHSVHSSACDGILEVVIVVEVFCFCHGFSGRARRFLVTCWNSTCSLVSWDLTSETLLDFLQGSFFRAENWTLQKICSRGGNILLVLTSNQPGFFFLFVS